MQSSKNNPPQYLLEVIFGSFVPKKEKKDPMFIKWKIGKV